MRGTSSSRGMIVIGVTLQSASEGDRTRRESDKRLLDTRLTSRLKVWCNGHALEPRSSRFDPLQLSVLFSLGEYTTDLA